MSSRDETTSWEPGWAGHEIQQLERLAALPLVDKLQWLEEAHHLVLHLAGAAPAPAASTRDDRKGTASSR